MRVTLGRKERSNQLNQIQSETQEHRYGREQPKEHILNVHFSSTLFLSSLTILD